jgi:hypothetical protein
VVVAAMGQVRKAVERRPNNFALSDFSTTYSINPQSVVAKALLKYV